MNALMYRRVFCGITVRLQAAPSPCIHFFDKSHGRKKSLEAKAMSRTQVSASNSFLRLSCWRALCYSIVHTLRRTDCPSGFRQSWTWPAYVAAVFDMDSSVKCGSLTVFFFNEGHNSVPSSGPTHFRGTYSLYISLRLRGRSLSLTV